MASDFTAFTADPTPYRVDVKIPPAQYDKLVRVAGSDSAAQQQFITNAIELACKINPRDNNIVLTGKDVAALSAAVGGKTLRSASDVVSLFERYFKLSVDGISFALDPETALALKEQYAAMGLQKTITYEDYVKGIFDDSLSLFLYGSTTGKYAYR